MKYRSGRGSVVTVTSGSTVPPATSTPPPPWEAGASSSSSPKIQVRSHVTTVAIQEDRTDVVR
ncbi:hypothetical protein E2C01_025541 [Portunus trituberculatus]|uniref:Uncharacterized protein n=1 Tax=Portunus trituberculatus TaxID=210409 RepID=A0A5B7EGQ2_PORTR|nr:hypothetical protein [Portunus trituberculatus]